MAVLLLNAPFEPLRVISLRRAIGLIVAGKAEIIAEGDGEIRSVSVSYPMPAVVRLRYMVRASRSALTWPSRDAPCSCVTVDGASSPIAISPHRPSTTSRHVRGAAITHGTTSSRPARRATPARVTDCSASSAGPCAGGRLRPMAW